MIHRIAIERFPGIIARRRMDGEDSPLTIIPVRHALHGFQGTEGGCRRSGIGHDGIKNNVSSLTEVGAEILRSVERFNAAFVNDDNPRTEHFDLGQNVRREEDGMMSAQSVYQVANKADLIRV